MRKRAFMTAGTALALAGVLLLAGCSGKPAPANGAAAAGSAAGTTSANGGAAEGKHVDAFGVVTPKVIHGIFLEFPAVLEKKCVSDGQKVRRGESLFLFSQKEYDAQVDNKKYELAMARLELKKSARDVQMLREDLQTAQEDVDTAQRDLDARQQLLSMGASSRSDVEELQRTLKARQQKVRELTGSLEEYDGSDVNNREAQQAKISILEGELERLEEQSERPFISGGAIVCDVREGVVNDIGYDEGDYVSKGKKLCSLIDLDSVIVEANIPEEFVKDVRIGSRAVVVPLADNGRKYEGKVTSLASLATNNNGETVVPVEIGLARWTASSCPTSTWR